MRRLIGALVLGLSLSFTLWASEQRVKVEGIWENGRILVHKVKERNPEKDPARIRVMGRIDLVDQHRRTFKIANIELHWDPDASYVSKLVQGMIVEFDAYRLADNTLKIISLREQSEASDGAIEIIGHVTSIEREGGLNRMLVGGVPVHVPLALYSSGRVRLRRLDDRRPSEQTVLALGSSKLVVGGEVGFSSNLVLDEDLDDKIDDDEKEFATSVQIEGFFDITPSMSGFLEFKLEYQYEIPDASDKDDFELKRGESWMFFDRPMNLPLSIQVGRQNFADERAWWWDADLDAVRVLYQIGNWDMDLAIARELGREVLNDDHSDAEEQKITRLIANAHRNYASALNLDVFFLAQQDNSSSYRLNDIIAAHKEDEDDADLFWLGARVSGVLRGKSSLELNYWADLAGVWGDETAYEFDDRPSGLIIVDKVTKQDRRGWAIDIGTSLTIPVRLEPTLTLGFARGSGDDDANGTFRDTGLNNYNDRFNGVSRFRYYGELSRPELSNLQIVTLAIGTRFGSRNSLELLYHHYQQLERSQDHSLRIDPDTNGRSKSIGDEIDVVLSMEQWQHLELETVGAYFRPGRAFDENDDAWRFSFKLNYNF